MNFNKYDLLWMPILTFNEYAIADPCALNMSFQTDQEHGMSPRAKNPTITEHGMPPSSFFGAPAKNHSPVNSETRT
jgi:hypothetical protein